MPNISGRIDTFERLCTTPKLDALGSISADAAPALREQGVFDRIYVDTLGGVVGTIETLAKEASTAQVSNATDILSGKGNVVQRLDDLADLFAKHLPIDLRSTDGLRWDELKRLGCGPHDTCTSTMAGSWTSATS